MAEYIERAAAVSIIKTAGFWEEEDREVAITCVNQTPAADVVEVVLCKNCRYYQSAKVNEKGFLICPASGMEITEKDYCSYGERMDKEDEHEAW